MFTMTSEKFKKLHGDHLSYLAKEGKDWSEKKADFSCFEMDKWIINGYNLSYANFSNCKFIDCTFSKINFDNCDFSGAKFYNCRFEECSLKKTKFRYSNIKKCIFTDGNNFENTIITKTVFEDIKTTGSIFDGMKMVNCIGTAIYATNCSVLNSTFKNNTLEVDIGNIEYEKEYFSNNKNTIVKYLNKDKQHQKRMLFIIKIKNVFKL